MASREERMQQRLRGAQRRQVKDVDFGLVFPAAAPVSDTTGSRTSPQPESLPRLSSRTPVARLQASNAAPADNISPGSHSTVDANTSAKRRKLDTDNTPLSSVRSTRSQRLPRPDIYALEDDNQDEALLDMLLDTTNDSIPRETVASRVIGQPTVTSTPATRSSTKTPLPVQVVDEVIESPRDASGSGHRIRPSIVGVNTSSSRLDIIQDEGILPVDLETPIQQNKRKRSDSRTRISPRNSRRSRQGQVLQNSSLELDELSPEQPSRRRPATMEIPEHEPVQEQLSIQGPDDDGEAEAIDDEQAAAILKRNKGRRLSRGVPMATSEVDDPVPSPATKKRRGRHRIDSTPAHQRQPKQAATKTKLTKTKKTIRMGSPIPVTVHRLTNPLVYDDEEEDADILNSEIPQAKRADVNTIDVLMEVSGEIVESAMQTLDDGGRACEDAALRREYKTKWQAVAAFGKELQTRLLEYTINLDSGYSFERRLRDEQKRKLKLRDEILRIRAEREQVALRIDEVRMKHENEKKKALSRDSLNSSVHDIEMAIDLGKQRQVLEVNQSTEMVDTEVLLKRVAGDVSNKGDSGGLLRHIKDFNAFLERAALVLEGRKG